MQIEDTYVMSSNLAETRDTCESKARITLAEALF